MNHSDHAQSGQTLVEYGLMIALIPFAILTLFIPATLVYLYLRRVRGADRQAALLAAFGVTLLVALLAGRQAKSTYAGSHTAIAGLEPEDFRAPNKPRSTKAKKKAKKDKRTAKAEREILVNELLPYTRYISRTIRAGGTIDDALTDIVRSQPETPLTMALAQAVSHAGEYSNLEESLSSAQDEDFEVAGAAIKAFFAILGTCVSPTRSAEENTTLLDGFFEEGLESGFYNPKIRPIKLDEVVTLDLELDPNLRAAIRQDNIPEG